MNFNLDLEIEENLNLVEKTVMLPQAIVEICENNNLSKFLERSVWTCNSLNLLWKDWRYNLKTKEDINDFLTEFSDTIDSWSLMIEEGIPTRNNSEETK